MSDNEFEGKVAVITGGASGIGKAIADEFKRCGALVFVIDKAPGNHFVGDIADEYTLQGFIDHVLTNGHCKVDYLINNAPPLMKGLDECSYDDFEYAMKVGVTAPFFLAKKFAKYFSPGAAIVNISSSRDRMSQPQTESYAAAKGGLSALTHALAISLAGIARVNSVSPGWIITKDTKLSIEDHIQQPVQRVGKCEDIVSVVMFLCSEKAGFVTGENICVDGGMTKQMIFHGDNGWTLKKQ